MISSFNVQGYKVHCHPSLNFHYLRTVPKLETVSFLQRTCEHESSFEICKVSGFSIASAAAISLITDLTGNRYWTHINLSNPHVAPFMVVQSPALAVILNGIRPSRKFNPIKGMCLTRNMLIWLHENNHRIYYKFYKTQCNIRTTFAMVVHRGIPHLSIRS